MLAAIVERILPEDFFSPSLLPSRACPLVLLDYVQEFTPKLHAHLTDLGVDLAAICFSWFLSLFTDCLPVEVCSLIFIMPSVSFGLCFFFLSKTLFRVWDVFLVDGLDVLFRIALGILRNNEAELLRCESIPAVYVALENLPTRMWEADKLIQVRSHLIVRFFHLGYPNSFCCGFFCSAGGRAERCACPFATCWETEGTCGGFEAVDCVISNLLFFGSGVN